MAIPLEILDILRGTWTIYPNSYDPRDKIGKYHVYPGYERCDLMQSRYGLGGPHARTAACLVPCGLDIWKSTSSEYVSFRPDQVASEVP